MQAWTGAQHEHVSDLALRAALGKHLGTFRAQRFHCLTSLALGTLSAISGVGLCGLSLTGLAARWPDTWSYGIGASLLLVGIVTVWRSRRKSLSQVSVHESGFFIRRGNRIEVYPWQDIACVREFIIYDYLPRGYRPQLGIPGVTRRVYHVERKDGQALTLRREDLYGLSALADLLRMHLSELNVPWSVEVARS